MAVSTASMWRRRESDCVHSQRRSQACSREISAAMAVTLAQRSAPAAPAGHGAPPAEQGASAAKRGAPPTGQAAPIAATLTGDRPPSTTAGAIKLGKFVIEGGLPLSGTITAAGNKNGALPYLAARRRTEDEVILRNVPRISDVEDRVRLLQVLGAHVEWLGPAEILIDSSMVDGTHRDRALSERIRASFLLAGPLLAPLRLRAYAPAGRRR